MKDIWHSSPVISPSLISLCDLCSIERSVKELEAGGAKLLHIDILDGYFSPSMPLGLDTVRRLRQLTELPLTYTSWSGSRISYRRASGYRGTAAHLPRGNRIAY